jgi:hypothetical protein
MDCCNEVLISSRNGKMLVMTSREERELVIVIEIIESVVLRVVV